MARYKSPEINGYRRVPVTNAEHNAIFINRRVKPTVKTEWYYKNGHLIIEYHSRAWAKLVTLLIAFLPSLIWDGLKVTVQEMTNLIFERSRGNFRRDDVYVKKEYLEHQYERVLKILER